jgi:hypothetical protein
MIHITIYHVLSSITGEQLFEDKEADKASTKAFEWAAAIAGKGHPVTVWVTSDIRETTDTTAMTLEQIQALTDDEIRVRVAELCGWTKQREIEAGYWVWIAPDGNTVGQSTLPNYPADLNAIQAAIIAHADSLPSRYQREEWLCMVEAYAIRSVEEPAFIAPARARCEAFLAVMQAGKGEGWKGTL